MKIRKRQAPTPRRCPTEDGGAGGPRRRRDNLVGIFAALSGRTKADVLKEFGGGQFSTFKVALADLSVAKLLPITTEMKRLLDDPAEIDRILGTGAERARAIARPVMDSVKDIVGFVRS
jgi:tryptophanyl-tRNA synthetase